MHGPKGLFECGMRMTFCVTAAVVAAGLSLAEIAEASETTVPQMEDAAQSGSVYYDTSGYEAVEYKALQDTSFRFGSSNGSMAQSGGNVARSFVFGNENIVLQSQFGRDNTSNVEIIDGDENFVGVLQAGYGLQSNVSLLNTQGLGVFVLQGPGSDPKNVFATRLSNGALLIAR